MLASRRRFGQALALIAVCALALRVYYTVVFAHNLQGPGDFYFYHWSANLLADGHGYIDPFSLAYLGITQPTAMHPPLWSFLLSVVSWFGGSGAPFPHSGGHDYFAHRLTGGVCGPSPWCSSGSWGGVSAARGWASWPPPRRRSTRS